MYVNRPQPEIQVMKCKNDVGPSIPCFNHKFGRKKSPKLVLTYMIFLCRLYWWSSRKMRWWGSKRSRNFLRPQIFQHQKFSFKVMFSRFRSMSLLYCLALWGPAFNFSCEFHELILNALQIEEYLKDLQKMLSRYRQNIHIYMGQNNRTKQNRWKDWRSTP